jgi:hypothetical protein
MTPERRARLRALAELHDQFVVDQLAVSPFDPAGSGSDYNIHYVDLEADTDEFHRRAEQLLRPAAGRRTDL